MSLLDRATKKIVDYLMTDVRSKHIPLCDFEKIRYEVRPCDVLLMEGRSRVSEIIKLITQSPWSHSALYVGRLHDIENPVLREHILKHYNGDPESQLLIEGMLGEGTIVTPLSHYEKDHIRICRPHGIARKDAQHVIGYAIGHLGMQYDVRQILDLARLLYPWHFLPRRWRSSLFYSRPGASQRQICSSLIAEAFSSVRFPILPLIKNDTNDGMQLIQRNPRLFTPSDFDYSPYFEIIKYPFFDVGGGTPYQSLPWNEEGFVSNDEHGLFKPNKIEKTDEGSNVVSLPKGS